MEPPADLLTVLDHWDLSQPISLRPVIHGVNNTNRIVETPTGRYVVRIYRHSAPDAVRSEHALLAALATQELPFAIPAPVPTRDGDTVVVVDGQNDGSQLLSLAPFLPGQPPAAGDLAQARAGGTALGHLTRALAAVPPWDSLSQVRFGDLAHLHQAVSNPAASIRAIPATVLDQPTRLLELLKRVQQPMLDCFARLPLQLVHGDFDGLHGNVLLDGPAVTAVLDFEFAGVDLRLLDLAIALVFWPIPADEAGRWRTYEAFLRGYASVIALTPAELEALPMLTLGQVFGFLIGSIGECLDGRDSWDRVVPLLARRALTYGAWLEDNEVRLAEHLPRWTGG